jgi:hypothetical protein
VRQGTVDVWHIAKGDTHLALPDANLVAKDVSPPRTAGNRAYRDAMDRIDSYGGDRKRLDEARVKLTAICPKAPAPALAGLARVTFVGAMRPRDSDEQADLVEAIDPADQPIARAAATAPPTSRNKRCRSRGYGNGKSTLADDQCSTHGASPSLPRRPLIFCAATPDDECA